VGVPLNIGTIVLEENENNVPVIDMNVTTALTQSSEISYAFRLDGNDILKVYAESDGAGGIQNSEVIVTGTGSFDYLKVDSTPDTDNTVLILDSNGIVKTDEINPFV